MRGSAGPPALIALTTDFGQRDHYVAAMKGVIASITPGTQIIDVTHEVQPHDVGHAAFVLHQVWSYMPPGTVHVAVVDPGVGSERQIILVQYDGRILITPDNGTVTFLHREMNVEAIHLVENRRLFLPNPSATFHGRDIMAPVAARIAAGLIPPHEVGRHADTVELLPVNCRAQEQPGRLVGTTVYVDRFGNLITNVHEDQILRNGSVRRVLVNGQDIGSLLRTFSDVPEGEAAAIIGSSRSLEVVCNRSNAAKRFGARAEIVVEVS